MLGFFVGLKNDFIKKERIMSEYDDQYWEQIDNFLDKCFSLIEEVKFEE